MRFLRFSGFTVPPIRPKELHICLWITWLFKRKLSYNTVRTYLYGLASEIKIRGGIDIVGKDHSWFIHSTLKHYKSRLGNQPIVYRRPLTVDLLYSLLSCLNLEDFNTLAYATMLAVGVICLLRIGELCSVTYNKAKKFIRNMDLSFGPGYVQFTLWQTKTDTERKGVVKYVANLGNTSFNPYRMILKLKALKKTCLRPTDAFFALDSGKPISRSMLVQFLQTHMKRLFPKIDSREWSGISLRKGGATSALRAGVPGVVIQKMGNWVSDIYKGYIDHSLIDVSGAQRLMTATMST